MSNGLDPDQDRHSVCPDLGQTFCKGYQQTTKIASSIIRVLNPTHLHNVLLINCTQNGRTSICSVMGTTDVARAYYSNYPLTTVNVTFCKIIKLSSTSVTNFEHPLSIKTSQLCCRHPVNSFHWQAIVTLYGLVRIPINERNRCSLFQALFLRYTSAYSLTVCMLCNSS